MLLLTRKPRPIKTNKMMVNVDQTRDKNFPFVHFLFHPKYVMWMDFVEARVYFVLFHLLCVLVHRVRRVVVEIEVLVSWLERSEWNELKTTHTKTPIACLH